MDHLKHGWRIVEHSLEIIWEEDDIIIASKIIRTKLHDNNLLTKRKQCNEQGHEKSIDYFICFFYANYCSEM